MRIIIYKSKYNWNETIEAIDSEMINEDDPIENIYYSLNEFSITNSTENNSQELSLIIKPFFKRKSKDALPWQVFIKQLVESNEKSIDQFMPESSYTFDSIILMKQPGSLNDNVYLITFGQAYHDIYEIIDFEFGIDFAEKSISNENVITKNVNFFQQNRLKEVTNYRRNSVDFARPTESYTSISGHPDNLERYGKTIHCSLGVSFLVPNRVNEFSSKVCNLIHDIDELTSTEQILNPFPRLKIVREYEKISILDQLLLNSLINTEENEISTVDLSRLIEIQNYIFFLDEMIEVNLFIKSSKAQTKRSLNDENESYISSIEDFINSHEITDINLIKIEIIDNQGESKEMNLKDIIHAEVLDEDKQYLLQNGKWGTFNDEFFDILNSYLDEIEVKQNFLSNNIEFKKTEEEFIFQFQRVNNLKYKVLHKHFIQPNNQNFVVKGNGIELADLYCSERNELITVKKGVNTSLSLYSLEQSMLAMNSLNHVKSYDFTGILSIITEAELEKLRFSDKNSIIWMLPIKASDSTPVSDITHTNSVLSNTFDLKDLGSVLLKNKLVEWAQFSLENRLKPTIYLECPIDLCS